MSWDRIDWSGNRFTRAAPKAVLNPLHAGAVRGASPCPRKKTAVSPANAKDTAVWIPPRGVEETRFSSRIPTVEGGGDVKSDVNAGGTLGHEPPALPPDILKLAAQLASLPPETLAALRALFGDRPDSR